MPRRYVALLRVVNARPIGALALSDLIANCQLFVTAGARSAAQMLAAPAQLTP
jgi:hypothetical protein